MNFSNYIQAQRKWSLETFGEGKRTEGIVKHIESELKESHYRIAVKNLKDAEMRYKSKDLFSMAGLEV